VATLTDEELTRLVMEDAAVAATTAAEDERERYRRDCLRAAARLDADTVHTTLMRAVVSLRPSEFLDEVLLPLLQEVGDRWHTGELSPAQEHVVSMSARRVVMWLIDAYDSEPGAPVVLITTVRASCTSLER
jgi:MerR family transcriptional regulator, light-induced transcriptional regulator